jgi:hypothetical protein
MVCAALLRYKNATIEIHEAHASIARIRLPTSTLDRLEHLSSGFWRNSECPLGRHQTDPDIRMIEKGQQRSPLITGSPFQFFLNCVHLPIKAIIFCIVVIEDRLIFLNAERCKTLDQLCGGEIVEVGVLHGLSTPNLRLQPNVAPGPPQLARYKRAVAEAVKDKSSIGRLWKSVRIGNRL